MDIQNLSIMKRYVNAQIKKKADKTHTHVKADITDLDTGTSESEHTHDNKTILDSITATVKSNYDTAYTHSKSTHAPTTAQKNSDITKSEIEAKLTGTITSHTHTKSQITDFPTLSTVATSGSYADLSNKPTIPTIDVTKSYVDTEVAKKVNASLTINSKPLTSNIILDRDDIGETLVTKSIASSTLTLSTNMYQTATMVTGTTIVLPTVSTFTEIHLLFSTTVDLTLTFPTVKWQTTPSIVANKTYEVIFTYPNSAIGWLGKIIEYS